MSENKIIEKIKKFDWSKIFKDGAGKESSKRIVGIVGSGVFLVMSVLTGFHFYDIDTSLILGGLGICTGLLGVSVLTKEA